MAQGEQQADYDRSLNDLIDAVYAVRPSFLAPRLFVEIRQPLTGDIANSVIRICKHGVEACRIRTLFPDRPDLSDNEDCSHIRYEYAIGQCVEQETAMVRDMIEGDELLVHSMVLAFKKFRVDTNVLDKTTPSIDRPAFSLVPNTGSDLVVAS